jgi:rhodanese-related sulfurtransferase
MSKRLIFTLSVLALGFALPGCQAQAPAKTEGTASSDAPASQAAPVITAIDADAYLKLKASTPGLQLLDVRTPEEVAGGIIEGASHINVHDADFVEKAAQALDKNAPLVLYCKAGGRSAKAADLLAEQGFSKIYNLTGGITAWESAGKPVQR